MRIVQLNHSESGRRIAVVYEPHLVLVKHYSSIYELANDAILQERRLSSLVEEHMLEDKLLYDEVYEGRSQWALLPAFDHPEDPQHCLITGTGLTHKMSAQNRQNMHNAQSELTYTDSMRMYVMGLEKGRPAPGEIGVQPEWFYKGNGTMLRAHGEAIEIPLYADDGGEEPEMVGIYLIDRQGKSWRIGFCTGNEFSDHEMEQKNYLYLAPSKIRQCAIGPELVITSDFSKILGKVSIFRNEKMLWEKSISTGENNMAHSLINLEYHHFKYSNHRIPGQVHIHFYGADAFSFGEGIRLEDGDMMEVGWEGMGRPLRNTVAEAKGKERLTYVEVLY